jgi:hypothetical protein
MKRLFDFAKLLDWVDRADSKSIAPIKYYNFPSLKFFVLKQNFEIMSMTRSRPRRNPLKMLQHAVI